jgi:hypothetical protein
MQQIMFATKVKHIHRKVKCAHLVPEPDSRGLDHVVPGSKRKIMQNQISTFTAR